MSIGILIATCLRTPSGRYDLKWRNGIETPSPPEILIGTIPAQSLTAGSAYSQDFSVYVSGTDKPGATYAIEAVSGTLAAVDLIFSGSTLSGATPDVGTFTGRLAVTKSGYTFRSDPFLLTCTALPVTDTQAPAVPPPPTATVNSATSITVAGYHSMDVATASVTASGISALILQRATVINGVEGAYSDRTTITAPSAGFKGLLVEATVGAPASVSTAQNGANYTIVSGLGNISGSSDNFICRYATVSGNFRVLAQLSDFDNQGNPSAATQIMIRSSLDPNAAFYRARRFNAASGLGIGTAWRPTTGGGATSSAAVTANIPADPWVLVEKVGNVLTTQFLDNSGVWVAAGTATITMADPVLVCVSGIRAASGTPVTFPINNLIIDQLPSWTYADTSVAATSYRYKCKARDQASNTTGAGIASALYTTTGAVTNAIRWHPGHYMLLDGIKSSPSRRATHIAQIAELANEPTIKGVKLQLYWGDVESGTTQGNASYQPGFDILDEYLDALGNIGKKMILSIQDRIFGGLSPSNLTNGYYFPQYVTTQEPAVSLDAPGYTTRVWTSFTNGRLIALTQALGARYNSDTRWEMYQGEETALGLANPSGVGYSASAHATQLKLFITQMVSAWPNTLTRVSTNFMNAYGSFSGDTAMADLLAYMADRKVAAGGPDTIPNQSIAANRIFAGIGGYTNWRGKIPWVGEVQSPSMGGKEGNFTPAQIWITQRDGQLASNPNIPPMEISHMLWYRKDWLQGTSNSDMYWKQTTVNGFVHPGILEYIRSINGAMPRTACPDLFNACATA